MKIDFSKIAVGNSLDSLVEPRAIFAALPAKHPRFAYLRDVQAEVLDGWFKQRFRRDTIIKLNTGGGKTVVALLLLKSCLNEGKGPAAYFAPDKYLAQQVATEAAQLGIKVVCEPRDRDFMSGNAILVDNIASLVNGRSVFGVKDQGVRIPLGSVVIDDAHASLERVEDQFTFVVEKQENQGTYERLLSQFRESLSHQSTNGLLEIEAGDPRRVVAVPYWTWQENLESTTRILSEHPQKDEFVWRLINDDLRFATCVVTGSRFEISTQCLPISHIRSYAAAERRIFLTATLARDSILTTHFGVIPEAVETPIVPSRVDDIGDRIILVPQQLNPAIEDEKLVTFAAEYSKSHNVVVIVPSSARAKRWENQAAAILNKDTIYEGVCQLRAGHVGLVVLVNKYDGVDLPDDACRLLIIDDIPGARRSVDRYSDSLLDFSEDLIGRRVQRIEQGMGRGVRSNSDHCAVILMGARLAEVISDPRAVKKFTPATATQFRVSDAVVSQVEAPSLDDIKSLIDLCIGRNAEWLAKSRAALANGSAPSKPRTDLIASARRKAFDHASIQQYGEIEAIYQAVISETRDTQTKGLLMQELAAFRNATNPTAAQELQRAALQSNRYLLKPIAGITYDKLRTKVNDQSAAVVKHLESFPTLNAAVIRLNALKEDLVFSPETTEEFERAMDCMAPFIGFLANRPEKIEGRGPDVLWAMGARGYLVIECKSGTTSEVGIGKNDCDQLGGAMSWFESKYGSDCPFTPVMVHPEFTFDRRAAPRSEMRIMDSESLERLRSALANYAAALGSHTQKPNVDSIAPLLSHFQFSAGTFVSVYTRPFKQAH